MLNDSTIRNAKPARTPYRIADSHGLHVEIRPTGRKFWRYRYRINGKENLFALGEYPARPVPRNESEADRQLRLAQSIYTLAEARLARMRARGLVKQGIHPAHARAAAGHCGGGPASFAAVAAPWLAELGKLRAPRYVANVRRTLEKDVFPRIGGMSVQDIKTVHVIGVIDRIKARAPHPANQAKMWMGAVFRHAAQRGLIDADPTALLKGYIKLPPVEHHAPLPVERIGPFLRALAAADVREPARALCRILWLTLLRINEARQAEWAEIDWAAALWRIPKERMKTRREHVIPLSRQAVAVLGALLPVSGGGQHVFASPATPTQPLSCLAPRQVFRRFEDAQRLAAPFTPHGVRATFSTLANEEGVRPDVIESVLAHQDANATRRAYNRSTFLPERTRLMQAWADRLDALQAGEPGLRLLLP